MSGPHAHDEYDFWRSDHQLFNVGLDCNDDLLPIAVYQDMVPPSIHIESDYSYVIDALEANLLHCYVLHSIPCSLYDRWMRTEQRTLCGGCNLRRGF